MKILSFGATVLIGIPFLSSFLVCCKRVSPLHFSDFWNTDLSNWTLCHFISNQPVNSTGRQTQSNPGFYHCLKFNYLLQHPEPWTIGTHTQFTAQFWTCVFLCVCMCCSTLSVDLRKYLWFSPHRVGDKARKRVWTQDVELALGQHKCSLSHWRAAKTQVDPYWCPLTQPAADQSDQLHGAANSMCCPTTWMHG